MKCLLAFVFTVLFVRADIDQEWMKNTLQSHFSQPRHHVTYPKYKRRAMRFIRDQFRDYGLETHVDVFPTLMRNVKGTNVLGVLKGKHFNTDNDVIVGIAAHYDTMRFSSGVDDNGAAVVAMLQAAKKVASRTHRNNTVIFAAFDFEEWEKSSVRDRACDDIGCGSKHFITEWVPHFWSKTPKVSGVMVMDTIMNFDEHRQSQSLPIPSVMFSQLFPITAKHLKSDGNQGDFLTVIGRPADSQMMNAFVTQFHRQGQSQYEIEKLNLSMLKGDYVSQEEFVRYNNFMRSDHATFWQAGIRAIFLTDTANFRGYMNKCYHQSCDTMERVNDSMIGFAAKTAKTLAATVDQLAPVVAYTNSGSHVFPAFILVSLALTGMKTVQP